TDNTAVCWGNNDDGRADAPGGAFTTVSAGKGHSCGVRTDNTVACWGSNDDGRADAPGGAFTAVSAGLWHSCGVRTDNTVTCWGDNVSGEADAPGGAFNVVSAGSWYSCGVRTDNTAVCWGNNDDGRADAPGGAFTTVSASSRHSCGVRTDNIVTCWGSNDDGQADAPGGAFTAVSAGNRHSCGVRTDNTVACWGNHSAGRPSFGAVPVKSSALKGWIEENVVNYYMRNFGPDQPHWLRESWYGVPLELFDGTYNAMSGCGQYHRGGSNRSTIYLTTECHRAHRTILHEIAHHFTLNARTWDGDREKDLARWSLWLYLYDLGVPIVSPGQSHGHIGEIIAELMGQYTLGQYEYIDHVYSITGSSYANLDTRAVFHMDTLAVLNSVSTGEVPQWFFDTYTTDSTLATIDLDKLIADLRELSRNPYLPTFPGDELLLEAEYIADMFLCINAEGERVWQNPWADGECDTRRPSAYTLPAASAEQVDASWRDPLHIQ
ncbi:MAG: hypothetical protein OXB92_15880, partial [Acidimicrobiaceae bacterium]|nr:hypothetical protein [Acidimicrobiaceae bacterium]